ncbi:MAG TPA: DUF2914 domain-containing protein [Smithellaceae bacterium]|nr:DUF2914 domain-containing protein [Smithellaceae bacterium]
MKLRIFLAVLAAILTAGFFFTAPAQAQEQTPGFSIERLAVARGIENREPVGIAETFSADTPVVYCFIEAKSIEADTRVTVAWIHEGKEIHSISLPLKAGPRWRTRSEKTLYGLTGAWSIEIRDEGGKVLKQTSFKVE